MNINKILESDFNKLNYNKDIEKLQNMKQNEKIEYIELYNAYRLLFTEYIIKKINLKIYDDKIEESKLNFISVSKENMDVYQYFSSDKLKYFYIKNNIYISRLTEDEKNFLNNRINSNSINLDDETTKFIQNTFERVIYEGTTAKNIGYMTMYGPNSKSCIAPNNSLIIGMRYDEFALQGLNEEQWKDLYLKQVEFLNQNIKQMEEEFNKYLEVSVNIIQYNDYNIIKRKS